MAGTVTWETLRDLASVEAERGCAISFFLNLDPSVAATAGDVQTRLNSLLDSAAKSGWAADPERSHEERQTLRSDLDRIRRYVENEFVRDGAHGLAVFCGSLDGIWAPLPLVEAVPDRVRLDRELALAPLAGLVGRGDGALVVVVGREQGRFYGLRAGRLEELADLSDEQPGRHDQGGWSQARFQRHIDELAAEHLRGIADELDRRVRARRGDVDVVVVTPEESRAELGGYLTQEVQQALAGWTQAEAHATPPELAALVEPILAARRAARERELLGRWREASGGARSAAGWELTLEALSDARVETLLAAGEADRPAWRCPSCGRGAASERDCLVDGTPLERVDAGLDLAVRLALRHGGTVWMVEGPELGPADGIGALLRF